MSKCNQPWLQMVNIEAWIGKRRIFYDLNLTLDINEHTVILGPNGAGKTTTIKCITGILKCDKGTIIIDGKNIENNDFLLKCNNLRFGTTSYAE